MCMAYAVPHNKHAHLCKLMLSHVCHMATCMTACSLVHWSMQAQLSNAALTGSVKFLQEDLAAAKSANTQLQAVLADKQQSWHEQSLSMQAEHEKQVYDLFSHVWCKLTRHLHCLHDRSLDLPGVVCLARLGIPSVCMQKPLESAERVPKLVVVVTFCC